MNKIWIFIGVAILTGIVVYFFLNKSWEIKNVPPKNDTILIFGDSLAEGVGSARGNDLASRLEKRLGKTVLNYGRSGDTTASALVRLDEALEENPGLVVIILGGNDVLKKVPKKETFKNLEKIITSFQDNGSAVILFGVRSGLFGDGRGDDFSDLAEKTGAAYLPDILKDIFGDSKYMDDSIHPNDAGYAFIEGRLVPVIENIFRNNK